jgi:diguanylate cyclase (GGDEF)-like protein
MSIRNKMFIYVVAFFATMFLLDYVVQRSIIFPSFLKIEHNEAAENIRRVMKSLDREIYHLDQVCHDWAQWNDSYDFIDSLSESYKNGNLTYDTFKTNNVNLIVYFKNDGTVIWGHAYNLEEEGDLPIDLLKEGKLDMSHPMLSMESPSGEGNDSMKSGVIDTSQGPMMFVTRPILRTDGSGPAKGMLTMGRFLNKEILESLKAQTRVDFEIDYPLTSEKLKYIKDIQTTYVENDFTFYTLTQDQFTDVRTFYKDVYGKEIFSIYYRFPREITKQGLASIWYARFLFIGSGLIVSILLLVMLQLKLIKPLQRLTEHALSLQSEEDLSIRLNLVRKDEIGTLAKSFDRLMQTISERTNDLKAANEKLTQLSQVDGLTGIANRRMFDESVEKEWRRMIRGKSPMSLILADVDFFKSYNDLYGHQMGDSCLIKVAGAISESIRRPADLCARYGGEEFVVILPNTDINGAFYIAENIRRAVTALNVPHSGSGLAPCVTLSLGLSTVIPRSGDDLSVFIRGVDQALYSAKESGRNRTIIFGQTHEASPV